ncbi:MAG: cobyric acid synthase CobQ, partial [Rhodosalinus sp.]
EIHIGETQGEDRARPFARVEGMPEGAVSGDGRIEGSYLHGMFRNDAFRAAYLAGFGLTAASQGYDTSVDRTLDALAAHLETHLDVDGLFASAR